MGQTGHGSACRTGERRNYSPTLPVKTTVQRSYLRNGQIYQKAPLRNGVQHGVVRTWHRNGKLATEQPYENGLLHGLCRQWNEQGKLLGQYRMVHGTGLQRSWHDNHSLQSEFFTLEGRFSGRCRLLAEDGTVVSDRLFLNGRDVSPDEYRQAAALDKRLPTFRGKLANVNDDNPGHSKHLFDLLVSRLLRKSPVEGRQWLAADDGKRRSLGRFRIARQAVKSRAGRFVNELYQAGAAEVLVPDIYFSKTGDHYADSLLVKLPKDKSKRAAVRKVCHQLKKNQTGDFLPERECGETYLYILPG
jgi:MORN repeat variant